MINKYKDKFMVWQLQNRTEIVIAVVAFVIGAIIVVIRFAATQKPFPIGKYHDIEHCVTKMPIVSVCLSPHNRGVLLRTRMTRTSKTRTVGSATSATAP